MRPMFSKRVSEPPTDDGERTLHEQVARRLRVIRDLQIQIVVPECRRRTRPPARPSLRLERRVPDAGLRERHRRHLGVVDADGRRVHVGDGVAEVRLPARLAVRGAETQRGQHPVLREETLFARDPRRVERRIVDPPEALAERAVAIAAEADVQEDAVAPRDLLLARSTPNNLLSVLYSATRKRALVPLSELEPGVSTAPRALVPWKVSCVYCPPSCVEERMSVNGVNVAVAVACAVQL